MDAIDKMNRFIISRLKNAQRLTIAERVQEAVTFYETIAPHERTTKCRYCQREAYKDDVCHIHYADLIRDRRTFDAHLGK